MPTRPEEGDGGAWGTYVKYIQDLEYLVEQLEQELAEAKKKLLLYEREDEGDRPVTG